MILREIVRKRRKLRRIPKRPLMTRWKRSPKRRQLTRLMTLSTHGRPSRPLIYQITMDGTAQPSSSPHPRSSSSLPPSLLSSRSAKSVPPTEKLVKFNSPNSQERQLCTKLILTMLSQWKSYKCRSKGMVSLDRNKATLASKLASSSTLFKRLTSMATSTLTKI